MLRFDLRALDQSPGDVSGVVPIDDELFEGLELSEPVRAGGRISSAGLGRYFWSGTIRTSQKSECRRCLAPATVSVERDVNVLFTEDQDADDPSEYIIPEGSTVLDLREALREELILALPEYVLCREGCSGMCPQCGTDLNTGSCACRPATDPRWAALEALRGSEPENEA